MKHKIFVILAAFLFIGAFAWAGGDQSDDSGTTGGVSSGKYSQSPFLDDRVASGELPPVDERLPKNPLVVTPLEEVGTYGGHLNIFSNEHPNPWARLVGENPEGAPPPIRLGLDQSFNPGLASEWSFSDDLTVFTMNLREGSKWSNGDPFSGEDWRFMYEDMQKKELQRYWGGFSSFLKSLTLVDEYTVRFEFLEPFPKAVNYLSSYRAGSNWGGYSPSTWLKQWHAEYSDDADAKAQEEGFDTWQDAFTHHSTFCCPQQDVEMPTMFPFMLTEVTQQYRAKERNPFYVAVDTAGQQLPYIDTALIQSIERETILLKIIGGEADFAERSLDDYPVLVDAQESGNFKIILIRAGWEGTSAAWMFNLNSADPVKREIFQNIEFRRAMSLALDRDRMNDVRFLGQATPVGSVTLYKGSSIYKSEWGEEHPYNRYAPGEANRMLDAIGLDKRNADGIRLMSDGRPFVIVYPMRQEKPTVINELLKEDFEAVGVGLELRTASTVAMDVGMRDGTVDFSGANGVHNELADYESSTGGINQWVNFMMNQWAHWWHEEHNTGINPGDPHGRMPEEPPAEVKEYLDVQILQAKKHPYGSSEQKRFSTRAWQILSDNLWQLGALQAAPLPVTYRANLTNVPADVGGFGDINAAFAIFTDQMFFKK